MKKRIFAFTVVFLLVLSLASTALASDSSRNYNITRLGVNGLLWSGSTVKKEAGYTENQYLVEATSFSTLDGGSDGYYTTRPYLVDQTTMASNTAAKISAKNPLDGYSLNSNYSTSVSFYFKFVGNPNYAIASQGLYSVGHSS